MIGNIGKYDRLLRIFVGLALLMLTVVGPKSLWGLVGLVPLVTGLVGSCALYSIFGISTAASRK